MQEEYLLGKNSVTFVPLKLGLDCSILELQNWSILRVTQHSESNRHSPLKGEWRVDMRERATVLALAALVLLGAQLSPRPAVAAERATYDLMVIVYAPDVGPAQVALSYAKMVDHVAIQKGLTELAQRTGAVISNAQVQEGRLGRGTTEMGTGVELAAAGLISPRGGALPVEPIIRSLPEWNRMRLVFVVGDAFLWMGPQATTADGFVVQVVSSMKPIEYDVERKSSSTLPSTEQASNAALEQARVSSAALPVALTGLLAGFFVGWLLVSARRR